MSLDKMELIKLLTSFNDINLNCRDQYQRTPLHAAAGSRILENVKFLTSLKGIDLNPVDKNVYHLNDLITFLCLFFYLTPLNYAKNSGSEEIAKFLVEIGCH